MLSLLEGQFGQDQEYVAGSLFTAADIMLGHPLTVLQNCTSLLQPDAFPKVAAYLARLQESPLASKIGCPTRLGFAIHRS